MIRRRRFLASKVIGGLRAKINSGRTQAPFFRIGIVEDVERRIIRDDEHFEIGDASVGQRVGLAGWMNEEVADAGGVGFVAGAKGGGAGADQKKFPLSQVRVERTDGGAGRDAADLHVKRMAAVRDSSITRGAEGDGEVLAERVKLARRRALLGPENVGEVDAGHGGGSRTLQGGRSQCHVFCHAANSAGRAR